MVKVFLNIKNENMPIRFFVGLIIPTLFSLELVLWRGGDVAGIRRMNWRQEKIRKIRSSGFIEAIPGITGSIIIE